MGTFSLNSDNLFLRSAGKNRFMVVKLTKDVHSSVVETKDWEVVEIIGTNMSFDTLEIFSHKLHAQKLKNLATSLSESRLWVNREGTSFIRLGINSLSYHIVFYKTNDLFNWAQFGVNKLNPNMGKNDDDEDGKSLEDLKKELKEYKDKLQLKEDELKKLQEKDPKKDEEDEKMKKLQEKLDKSMEDYNKIAKDFKAEKDKVTKLEGDVKEKGKEVTTLNKKLDKSMEDYNKVAKDFNAKKDKVTELEGFVKDKGKEVTNLNGKLKKTKDELDDKITNLKEDLRKSREENKKASSSSSSSSSSSVITQYDQILHKWRRPVWPSRFITVYSGNYSADFSSMPTCRPMDVSVLNRPPINIGVYVSNGSFEKENWWFIMMKNETTGYESKFAFYGGINDSIGIGSGRYEVKIPYSRSATFKASVRFFAVALRGYGAVFGFWY